MLVLISNIIIVCIGLSLIIKNKFIAKYIQSKLNSGFQNTYGRLVDLNSTKVLLVLRFIVYGEGLFILWAILWPIYINNSCIYMQACFL